MEKDTSYELAGDVSLLEYLSQLKKDQDDIRAMRCWGIKGRTFYQDDAFQMPSVPYHGVEIPHLANSH